MKTFEEYVKAAAKGKNKKPKAKADVQNDHEELEVNRNVGSDDSKNESSDSKGVINDVARMIKTEKVPLLRLGKFLKPMFGVKNVSFSDIPEAHFKIKLPNNKKLIIINKKYATGPEMIVGEIAIGHILR